MLEYVPLLHSPQIVSDVAVPANSNNSLLFEKKEDVLYKLKACLLYNETSNRSGPFAFNHRSYTFM